jgi:hypothetical protein
MISSEKEWSRGLLVYLGQMCTVGRITSTTPRIALHVLDCMLASHGLNSSANFDIFLDYLMRAGPFLDGLGEFQCNLMERMVKLQERTKAMSMTVGLAVYGVLQLREKGWQMEEAEGVAQDGLQAEGFTLL